jgi:tRNA threonylcarbamoyl adenosine modification protein YeaZ
MKILALDFSTSQRGPAFQSEIVEVGGRSPRAFGMIERALAEARLERQEIECIAVGLGPGSYTGIRAAIAIAQGWQLACGIKLLGLSTVEVLAARAQQDGVRGTTHVVVDAQRGEFYCASWMLTETGWTESNPLSIVKREEIEALLATGEPVIGPDLKRSCSGILEVYPSARTLGILALGRTHFTAGEHLAPVYLRETTFVKAPAPRQTL